MPREIKEDMTKLFVALAVLLPISAVAEQSKPPKPSTVLRPVKENSCAQYGPGFVRVADSDTCVKVGGSVRVDVGSTR
jgi:hypothetical protein